MMCVSLALGICLRKWSRQLRVSAAYLTVDIECARTWSRTCRDWPKTQHVSRRVDADQSAEPLVCGYYCSSPKTEFHRG